MALSSYAVGESRTEHQFSFAMQNLVWAGMFSEAAGAAGGG
jgi:hypothetical protein